MPGRDRQAEQELVLDQLKRIEPRCSLDRIERVDVELLVRYRRANRDELQQTLHLDRPVHSFQTALTLHAQHTLRRQAKIWLPVRALLANDNVLELTGVIQQRIRKTAKRFHLDDATKPTRLTGESNRIGEHA